MTVRKNVSSGSENTALNVPEIKRQMPVRNAETVIDTSKREKGVWGVPHTPCVRHQPRAARLALRKMEKPRVTRPAQMNSVRMGLAVMMSQTSPTSVASVLVLPRMVATVVEAAVSVVPSFHRFDGCGRRTRTSISGVRTRPATLTHIPPCNTLQS